VSTFDDLVDEVLGNLQGYTAAPDQVTALTTGIDADDTSLTVDEATYVSRGMIEIDDELMYVQSVNTNTNLLTLLPQGRGWRRTTAATHDAGATVVVNPTVPRAIVKTEINNQINALYPNLFATTEFDYDDVIQSGWELPAAAVAVLDVRYKDTLGNWQRVRSWEVEWSANTTDFTSGTMLRFGGVQYGQPVRVVYAKRPTALTDGDDVFATVTGLSESARDVVTLGTMIRLVPNMDIARLSVQKAEAQAIASTRQIDAGTAISRDLQRRYAIRLSEERKALNMQYPARIHFGR
jgi:hypothetical protein